MTAPKRLVAVFDHRNIFIDPSPDPQKSFKERQRLFDRQAAQMPIFAEYQQKTTRQIPVLVLTRLD